jgi:hypothetical protein
MRSRSASGALVSFTAAAIIARPRSAASSSRELRSGGGSGEFMPLPSLI